ncbi:hypothetical protein MMC24_006324 [Lignoscripta atroalba]|nr:hypothetical protein [Lignoscripta atroalba]
MNTINRIVVRDDADYPNALTPTIVNLLIALLSLVFVAICCIGGLFILRANRKSRQRKQSELPLHNSTSKRTSNHRRLTITATPYGRRSESICIYNEKQTLIKNSATPPHSPIPEIRITFPEEEDDAGKRKSGRVVVVRISETGGVGLEPYEENLPPYQTTDSDRFQSLDLERMGGLKEKEHGQKWS